MELKRVTRSIDECVDGRLIEKLVQWKECAVTALGIIQISVWFMRACAIVLFFPFMRKGKGSFLDSMLFREG